MAVALDRYSCRSPTDRELERIPWMVSLDASERDSAARALKVGQAEPGEIVCRRDRPARYYLGVLEGMLKLTGRDGDDQMMAFTGVPTGGWFGEGTALKRESYRFEVEALRRTALVGMPLGAFHDLLDKSLAFNRFVMEQLNERLGQFIAARDTGRLRNPDMRVARCLAALFDPALFPGTGDVLRITQEELAQLAGLSRQRMNKSLSRLRSLGIVTTAHGSLRIHDFESLRSRCSFATA